MKKYFWNFLVIFTCTSTMIASNVISLQTTKTKSGDNGTFSIVMKNDVSVNGLHFAIRYDPDLITPIKLTPVDRGASLAGSTASLSGDDKINFIFYDNGFNLALSDSEKIFEVEYTVTDSLGDSAKSELVFTDAMAADSSILIIPFEFINGEISISAAEGVEEGDANLPAKYELYQNYPNPFNPTTKLSFVIGHSSLVTLKVYDILGRVIATLVNEKINAGKYEVIFDGSGLSSGVYFYRLNAGQYTNTKKFILMK
jgi:hypothetical protein